MNKVLQFLFLIIITARVSGQDFTGQWKGNFTDNSTSYGGWGGNRCDYVLELDCKGNNVTGYSYTYFNEGGKRYYTICRLTGKINKASKYVEVTEVERTKTNVPNNIRNCFQIHKLTYFQKGEEQNLEGSWVPASGQMGDCGYGTTSLSRRILQKIPNQLNNSLAKNDKPNIKQPVKPSEANRFKNPFNPPLVKSNPKTISPPVVKANPVTSENEDTKTVPEPKSELPKKIIPDISFEKRSSDLLKTIEIESETFTVNLYDNGEVDGDSISLFYNGNLVLQHKRLSERPITITLKVDDAKDVNELVMYAENLGEIPPNTALMVVRDGENRYEVRISSDLQKSGVIRFIHRPRSGQ